MDTQGYEKPRIVRHSAGRMNKYGFGSKVGGCPEIDGVSVSSLARDHGSPVFVFSERRLRETLQRARRAFESRYERVQFAWSYKTNYLKAICAIFHQEGWIAEVVSDFEYEKARALGVPGRDIIYNGPYKTKNSLRQALQEGSKIQLDNLDELIVVEELAAELDITSVGVGIRVYMDAGIRPVWSKFGFNLDDGEAWRAVKRIKAGGRLRLQGVHSHLGTYILETDAYRVAGRKLAALALRASDECGFEVDYINLGGGFPSTNLLHGQSAGLVGKIPDFEDFAEAISSGIKANWPGDRELPLLHLETGRALVDESGYLITSVVATKRARSTAFDAIGWSGGGKQLPPTTYGDGHSGLLVDAGVNILYTATWYQFRIRPEKEIDVPPALTTLYGCLCMNIDVIRESVPLPPLEIGDRLVIHPVGAYNVTQSMQFITYRPRVVLITESGDVEVIREKEDLEHVERMERLPNRLSRLNIESSND